MFVRIIERLNMSVSTRLRRDMLGVSSDRPDVIHIMWYWLCIRWRFLFRAGIVGNGDVAGLSFRTTVKSCYKYFR